MDVASKEVQAEVQRVSYQEYDDEQEDIPCDGTDGVEHLADNAAGLTAAYSERGLRDLVTQTATVHYIRAAQLGEHIVAEGKLVHGGRSTALVNVEIRNDAGKLLLQGEFSMFYLDPPEDE